MILRPGTSGYSYKEWKGVFYPEKLPAKEMLAFYAGRLPAVEINNTFYRMPNRQLLESWAEQVPPDFRFAVKAPRRITHVKRLRKVEDEVKFLLDTVAVLGPRLGVLLFQLPPSLRKDRDRLAAFLDLVPPMPPVALEFRHPSWLDEDIVECLRANGATLCAADTDENPDPAPVPTSSHGYLRLRRADYDDDDLRTWIDRIAKCDWKEAFVFFKHEDEGAGPRFAIRLLELANR